MVLGMKNCHIGKELVRVNVSINTNLVKITVGTCFSEFQSWNQVKS